MLLGADELLPDPIRLDRIPPLSSTPPKKAVAKKAKKGEFNLYEYLRKEEKH
jgi:hypothetical protein